MCFYIVSFKDMCLLSESGGYNLFIQLLFSSEDSR
jgi:hypothetical protein